MDEIPCTHAMIAIKKRQMDPYKYCSTYYKIVTYLGTYEGIVYSVGDLETWEIPEELQINKVEPPIEKAQSWETKATMHSVTWRIQEEKYKV